MKKIQRISLLLVASCATMAGALANDVSRSFYSINPFYKHLAFHNTLIEDAHSTGRALKQIGLQAYVFGSRSTNNDDLARYFLFNNKKTLTTSNSASGVGLLNSQELAQDIQVGNFNCSFLNYNYASTLTMDPVHTVVGFGLSARSYFREYFWGSLDMPVVHVNNDLRLSESIQNNGGGAGNSLTAAALAAGAVVGIQGATTVTSMRDAFRQQAMSYGKIDGAQKKTGLGDMTLRIGYDSVDWSNLYMTTYIGAVLPTSNKPKAVYVFEPMLGNNGHAGILFGNRGQFDMCKMASGRLWVQWAAESQYLFENTQKRSFDLYRNGPWSRYLSMFASGAARAGEVANTLNSRSFGINLMTQDAKVTPRLAAQFDTAFHYVADKLHMNVGFTTNLRQSEEITLANNWQQGPMVAALIPDTAQTSNPFRSIGTELDGLKAASDSFIQESDIDLSSAAHPAYVSTTVHAGLGGFFEGERPRNFEIGASYEFSQHNASLNRWGLWGKAQISF